MHNRVNVLHQSRKSFTISQTYLSNFNIELVKFCAPIGTGSYLTPHAITAFD